MLDRKHGKLSIRRQCELLGIARSGVYYNRKRVQRLMRQMGIAALSPKPRTTKPTSGRKVYPCLLRDMMIDRPNQVWAADITYIPIGRGFLYLVAIMDWRAGRR
jgi:putative transposase